MSELRRKIHELMAEIECEYGIKDALPVTEYLSLAYDGMKKLEADHAAEVA